MAKRRNTAVVGVVADEPPPHVQGTLQTMRRHFGSDRRAYSAWVDAYRQSAWRSPPVVRMRLTRDE